MQIDELIETFRQHLYLPDPGVVEVMVGAVVANRLPGDPVWLLLVGPPSSGKTEALNALSELPDVHFVSNFTRAGLLSGSVDPRSTGGLLVQLGAQGILCMKDFTSVLSESSDLRQKLLADLREVYDGLWARDLGNKKLYWQGKAGLIGAVTETIDRHAAVIGSMGERLLFYRMPKLDDEGRLAQGRAALANVGRQDAMRHDLSAAVARYFAELTLPSEAVPLDGPVAHFLVLLADLATRCRSVVEREVRDRQVELVPQDEALGRLQAQLGQLVRAFAAMGLGDEGTRLLVEVALGSMPKLRRQVVETLASLSTGMGYQTAWFADTLGLPTAPVGRALEDLAAHGVVLRDTGRHTHLWSPSEWLLSRWAELGLGTTEVPPITVIEEEAGF
jgi:hypothetical protein